MALIHISRHAFTRCIAAICVLAIGAQIAAAHAAPTAIEQFQTYQAALAKDAQSKDWKAYLADAKQLKDFLHDAPTSRLEVARTYLRLGNQAAALAETRGFLALGQTNTALASPLFDPIRSAIAAQIEQNQSAISHASTVFELPETASLPEDIDFDPSTKQFFITAVLGKKIVSVDLHGVSRTFAEAPDGWPMVALKIDPKHRRLWVTEVAFSDFKNIAPADRGHSVLLEYDLDHGHLLSRIEGPAHSGLGDMALTADGEPIVSDGDDGGVYRVDHEAFRRIDHGEFISPQTPAFCDGSKIAFVPDYVRGLARLNLETGKVVWLRADRHALYGIDGLYCHGHTLTATQNGATPARVVEFKLDAAGTAVIGERVIERGTSSASDVTHGVFVSNIFYFIAHAGWETLDDQGSPKPDASPTRAVLMRVAR